MTVRTRLQTAVFATPEDTARIKSTSQPIDLKIFLFLLDFLCCLCSRCRTGPDEEAPPDKEHKEALEATLMRWQSIHRHATENNVTVGMVFLALYVTQGRCLSQAVQACDPDPVVTEVFIYLYLACRLMHFFIYTFAIRQPYRAIVFILTNICLTAISRQVIAWSEAKSPKMQASTFGESSGEALPISFESVEETRQAVVMAKNLVASGPEALPRGVTSVLRHALRLVVQSA
eukprot:symbB.v1.2.016158.t1/scaffold1225.1/size130771/3